VGLGLPDQLKEKEHYITFNNHLAFYFWLVGWGWGNEAERVGDL
jgi:hypothetical protein